ncbi:hypothetical protein ACQR16_32050 [Bradyrhizobium oligotrophicum]|uniref:hypothetical protein n=1 Tax=Bradyrhizobium oligotrophicum TaxID=44255 RepID=UPI003EBA64EA
MSTEFTAPLRLRRIAPPLADPVPHLACDQCGSDMTHLGDLPAVLGAAAVRVFRCYSCNIIASIGW